MQLGKGTIRSAMVGVEGAPSLEMPPTPTPTTSDPVNVTRVFFGCEMEVPIATENGGVIQPPEKMAAKD